MIRLQALARYQHRGRLYERGEAFDVDTPGEADDLVAVGFARRAQVPAIEAKSGDADEAGRYNRRDMRPEK